MRNMQRGRLCWRACPHTTDRDELTLNDIIISHPPHAQFAFLAARRTAEQEFRSLTRTRSCTLPVPCKLPVSQRCRNDVADGGRRRTVRGGEVLQGDAQERWQCTTETYQGSTSVVEGHEGDEEGEIPAGQTDASISCILGPRSGLVVR